MSKPGPLVSLTEIENRVTGVDRTPVFAVSANTGGCPGWDGEFVDRCPSVLCGVATPHGCVWIAPSPAREGHPARPL